VRIATWNINGLQARLGFLLHWLRQRQPDVVGVQELKLVDDQFPHAELRAAGYHAICYGQKGWNGVAILSREPARLEQRGLPGQEEFGARLLSAEVGDLSFTTLYCPNGKHVGHPDFPRKLAWLDALADHFEARYRAEQTIVLAGDFNLCPGALDSYDEARLQGSIFHTDDERSRFKRLLQWGFRDVFREKFPTEQRFSWWDYRAGAFHMNRGLRIDLLLATSAALARVRAIEIDRDYRKKKDGMIASDHAPVLADLEHT